MFHILDKWNFEESKTSKKKHATLFEKNIYIRFEKLKETWFWKKDNYRKAYETNKSRLHFAEITIHLPSSYLASIFRRLS